MPNSIKNSLQLAKPYLNSELISSESFSQISQIANILPTLPVILKPIFECHLGLSTPRVDFSVDFTTKKEERKALVDYCDRMTTSLAADSAWSRIRDFCSCWANPKSSLYNNVDHVWLEFDLDKNESSKYREPSFFFYPLDIKGQEKQSFPKSISGNNYWVTDEALRILFGKFLPETVKNQVINCFEFLPPGAEVYQIGVMLPRKVESQAVRICVKNIATKDLLQYLKNLGWLDSLNTLSSLLAELSNFVDEINLSFSVENTILPKIGFECYLDKSSKDLADTLAKWQQFLNYLVKHKLCPLEEAKALLNWSGYSQVKRDREMQSDNLAKASAFVYPHLKSIVIRKLNHIKIVYQPQQPLQAKAYLWFGHRWLSSSGFLEKSSNN